MGEALTGAQLTPELLHSAYLEGAFPMGEDESDRIEWYEVSERCLFPIEGIRVSRSLAKTLKDPRWSITFDTAFSQVVRKCLRPPGHNWITPQIERVYTECFEQGWGHSVEVWREGDLVGGSYGLAIGTCFSAESMFHTITDASKVALYHLINRCREVGVEIFDAEVWNPHLESLGAYTIPNSEFLERLRLGLAKPSQWACPRKAV